jgi:hypothetical protein
MPTSVILSILRTNDRLYDLRSSLRSRHGEPSDLDAEHDIASKRKSQTKSDTMEEEGEETD